MKRWNTNGGYRIVQVISGRSNVFLLTDERVNILVDTGVRFMRGSLKRHLNGLKVRRIDYLILTHTHFDHTANASWIKENYGAKVIIHRSEALFLTKGEGCIISGTNIFSRMIVKLLSGMISGIVRCEPCSYDIIIDSLFDLSPFGFNAYILHTPGHSPGSVSIIVDDQIALVGDTMIGAFKWTVFPPFACDTNLLIKSWGRLLDTKCKLFIPSHGSVNSRSLVEKDYIRHNG